MEREAMQYAALLLWGKGSGAYNQQWHSSRICFVPGSESDVQALRELPMTVAPESNIYGDSAYTGKFDGTHAGELIERG